MRKRWWISSSNVLIQIFLPSTFFFLSPHIYILIQYKRDRCTSDISDINTTCKTRRHTHTHIHTCEKSGWRRGRFGRERFKDRLIRERARNRYRGGAAAPNLRDFFQNYEAARNPRDTSPLIKRIAGLGGWFKFCTCPTVTRGGKKKRRKREFLPFFSPPSPPFFPSPMQGRDSFPLPRVAPFLSRGQRDRSEIPPFKRPIPTSGYQRRNEARAFFSSTFCATLAKTRKSHGDRVLGNLFRHPRPIKIPESRRKTRTLAVPSSLRWQWRATIFATSVDKSYPATVTDLRGEKNWGARVVALAFHSFIHSFIRPPIFWHGRADRFLDDSENH